MKKQKFVTFTLIVTLALGFSLPGVVNAETMDITFPVLGGATYTNDYGDARVGGRKHEGNDLVGKKMQPLLAATDGVITFLTANEATWGYSLTITDDDGYEYNYLHLNNDTPGTDDGKGGYNNAFAPDIKLGSKVIAGQAVGFLGDSGNAETTPPHLHFEIRNSSTNSPINPYSSLQGATVLSRAVTNDNADEVEEDDEEEDSDEEDDEDRESLNIVSEFYPYEDFEGGATITSANLDKDEEPEFVTGTAFGGGGRTIINTYDTDGTKLNTFFAYGEVFRGGGDVATADVDSDGVSEIITSAGPGGGPHIKIFKPNGTLVSEFMAYGAGFRGGVYLAAADINDDGETDIVTGPGSGGGPHVKVFNKSGKVQKEFMAYNAGFTGGVDVSAFDEEDDFDGGIVTAPGPGGGPHVKVFNYSLKLTGEFMAYPASFSGGVRVDSGNIISGNSSFEVVTSPATSSSTHTKIFKTNGSFVKASTTGFESLWAGGADVAIVGTDVFVATSGGRKTAVKKVLF